MGAENEPTADDPEQKKLHEAASDILDSAESTVPGSRNIVNAHLAHIEKHAVLEKKSRPGNHTLQRKIAFDAVEHIYAGKQDMLEKIKKFREKIDAFIKES